MQKESVVMNPERIIIQLWGSFQTLLAHRFGFLSCNFTVLSDKADKITVPKMTLVYIDK